MDPESRVVHLDDQEVPQGRNGNRIILNSLWRGWILLQDVHWLLILFWGIFFVERKMLAHLLCKREVGKMPTLIWASPVACLERVEMILNPLGSGMLAWADSRSSWGSSAGLSSNSADSHKSQREGDLPTQKRSLVFSRELLLHQEMQILFKCSRQRTPVLAG